MEQQQTFLFHDYETWGADPRRDFPCQFAAIRTDESLEPIGDPVNITCQIPNDYLPHPGACIVTGITPQQTLKRGMVEAEFAAKIQQIMQTPNTCSVGYNSIRFDDEVTRFMLYRNFHDPYEREWKNGNSRWDIIDLARACYALRPDGIEWAFNEEGLPSFKLEALTKANNIEHEGAHDALVDVRATIGLAKLIKTKQPKLFDYALSLRKKNAVWQLFNFDTLTPLLHVSSKIPAAQGCCTWILPIAIHPTQPNAVVCIDLSKNIEILLDDSTEELKRKLYAKSSELDASEERPGIKLIHVNKSPFVTTAKALNQERAIEIGLDRETCLTNYKRLTQTPQFIEKVLGIYREEGQQESTSVEHGLYSSGFMTDDEKRHCVAIRQALPENLAALSTHLPSDRLKSLLFLYRGRNYPQTLTHSEMVEWQRHREQRLTEGGVGLSITEFAAEIDRLAQENTNQPKAMSILKSLHQYVQNL